MLSELLDACETLSMTADTLNYLRSNYIPCHDPLTLQQYQSSLDSLFRRYDIDVVSRISRVRWLGHIDHSTGWIAQTYTLVCLGNPACVAIYVNKQKKPNRPGSGEE